MVVGYVGGHFSAWRAVGCLRETIAFVLSRAAADDRLAVAPLHMATSQVGVAPCARCGSRRARHVYS